MIEFALHRRLPSAFPMRYFVDAGGGCRMDPSQLTCNAPANAFSESTRQSARFDLPIDSLPSRKRPLDLTLALSGGQTAQPFGRPLDGRVGRRLDIILGSTLKCGLLLWPEVLHQGAEIFMA